MSTLSEKKMDWGKCNCTQWPQQSWFAHLWRPCLRAYILSHIFFHYLCTDSFLSPDIRGQYHDYGEYVIGSWLFESTNFQISVACCLFGGFKRQVEQGDHGRTMILHTPLPNMLNRLVTVVVFSGQCFCISPICIVDLFLDIVINACKYMPLKSYLSPSCGSPANG